MLGASSHNEGKIHLGFVYALDQSGHTRRRMVEGAMTFAPLLDRLCGPLPWDTWRTETYRYAVMPDSLAGPEVLESAYTHLRALLPQLEAESPLPLHYVGTRPQRLWQRSSDRRGGPLVDGKPVECLYETEEVSVDPRELLRAITQKVREDPNITLCCGTRVVEAERVPDGFRLHLEEGGQPRSIRTDTVVNCTWEDRMRLDATLGIRPTGTRPCFRVKYQVLVRPRKPDPSLLPVTMVQGPYGDVVPWKDGVTYLSWYPTGRVYFAPTPPPARNRWQDEAGDAAKRSLAVMARMFPALQGAQILAATPCVIIARGDTDVHDIHSTLHGREHFGTEHHDGWWSVDPGKMTTAPLIADRTVTSMLQELGCAAG